MTGSRAEIVHAEAAAAAARKQMFDTLDRLKYRVNPRVRAGETLMNVRAKGEAIGDDMLEFAYEKPRAVVAVAGVGALILLRRPVGRLLGRLVFWRRPKWDTTPLPHHPADKPKRLSHKGGNKP